MQYSRSNPSARYRSLVELYGRMHAEGDPQAGRSASQVFSGQSLLPQLARIKRLVARTGAENLLDYGCGKARIYDLSDIPVPDHGTVESVVAYWDVAGVCFYDPGYAPFRELPAGKFDGVIATDVLEHCPEEDLPWILEEIFGYARLFVFANVASYPARKSLPNGENAHCTVRAADWWRALVEGVAARHPGVLWEVWVEDRDAQNRSIDLRLGNFEPGS